VSQCFRWVSGKGLVRLDGRALRLPSTLPPPFGEAPCLLLLPPLWDHHGHVEAYGSLLEMADLRGCLDLGETLSRLKAQAASLSPGSWIEGFGWDQNLWGGEYPDRWMLDAVFPDDPVYLRRIDGHAAWVNSLALCKAGIDDEAPDPEGGFLLRRDGRLTGILVDKAMDLVSARIPVPDDATLRRRILAALKDLRLKGLSGVTDMGLERGTFEAFKSLDREGALLPIPVEGFFHVSGSRMEAFEAYSGDRFWLAGGKLFADGALGSRGAALHGDYCDCKGERGLLLRSTSALAHAVHSVVARGLTPAVHAIGDRAVSQVLDAFSACRSPIPPRLEHAQIVADGDVERMARLGVVASVQPCHRLSDEGWIESRLGDRVSSAYRLGSFRRAGIRLLLGTDFPIEEPDPIRNFLASATHSNPGERLDVASLLAAYSPPPSAPPIAACTLVACETPRVLDGEPQESHFISMDLPGGSS
jgi:predicted amidohydrolase YtcJ